MNQESALFSLPEPFLAAEPAKPARALAKTPAQVVVDSPLPHLDREFDYAVPEELDDAAAPGVRVKVRFAGQELAGYIVSRNPASTDRTLAPLAKVVSDAQVLTEAVLTLARAVAARYAGTVSDVLRVAVPPRVAKVEKDFAGRISAGAASSSAVRRAGLHVDAEPFTGYAGAEEFLRSLGEGGSPRAALTSFRGFGSASWTEQITAAIAATAASGRGALVVLPDQRELDALKRVCEREFGADAIAVLNADDGPTTRYRAFINVLTGARKIVLGLRSAAFAPVQDLGLLVCWDDGDDLLAERRAPYQNAREVLLLRAAAENTALLFASHTRTTTVQRLVASGWLHELVCARPALRSGTPRMVNSLDSFETERDPLAQLARIPQRAWQTAKTGLLSGPVLVQVARAGYAASLACSTCRAPARCGVCGGPLAQPIAAGELICRWCATPAPEFTCSVCGGHQVRRTSVGVVRTAEELGRAFPGVTVISSAGDHVKSTVPDQPVLVVATVGAEPVAVQGYAAALLLDGDSLLRHEHLNAAEEALRRWFNAAALVQESGTVVLVATPGAPADALIRWDPAGFAQRELATRQELALPPSVRFAAITGPAGAVESFTAALALPPTASVLGPVTGGVPAPGGQPQEARSLVFFPYAAAAEVTAALRAGKVAGSAKRLQAPVQVRCDPVDVL